MLKTKLLVEVIDHIISKYPDTIDFIHQKLIEKCDREGISIDKIIYFLIVILKPSMFYQQI